MRHLSAASICAILLTLTAPAQSRRELLGKVVKGDDQSQTPAVHAKVVLDESGSHDISDDDGHFRLFIPDLFSAGHEITIKVTLPGFAVYEPAGGRIRLPDDLARARQQIVMLPKDSPKFKGHAQIKALIERTARESSSQVSQPGSKEPPDSARSLKDWAVEHGFGLEDVRREVNRWASEVESRKSSFYDLGLAAFAKHNFGEANERALDAAEAEETSLATLQKQQNEHLERAINAYRLAGDAAYSGLDFEKATVAYKRGLAHTDRNRNSAQRAGFQVRIGNAEQELSSRTEGQSISKHSQAALAAYNSALAVYTKEIAPRDWAATKNNIGIALLDLAERSEGSQAMANLQEAVTAYRSALQVRTLEQLPQDWAATQNNIGHALRDLAVRSEGRQAASYLEQAVTAYRSAIEVFNREQLTQGWAMTQNNLAVTLWDLAGGSEGSRAAAYLKQAVTASRSALEVLNRDQLPRVWAGIQTNLGAALGTLGRRSEGPKRRRTWSRR